MRDSEKGTIIGIVGFVALVASWAALWFAPHLVPAKWVPHVWMAVLIALPCSILLGVIAGRMSSKRWYFLVGVSTLSAAILLAGAAV